MLDILNLGLWRFRNLPCLLRRRMGLGMRWDRLGWRRGMSIFDSEVIMGTGLILMSLSSYTIPARYSLCTVNGAMEFLFMTRIDAAR